MLHEPGAWQSHLLPRTPAEQEHHIVVCDNQLTLHFHGTEQNGRASAVEGIVG